MLYILPVDQEGSCVGVQGASGVAARGHGGYQAWPPAFPLPGVGQPCQTGGVPWSNEGALALGDTGLGLRLHGALACSAPPAPHRHGELRPPKWPQARAKGLLRASILNKTHEHPGHRNGSFWDEPAGRALTGCDESEHL